MSYLSNSFDCSSMYKNELTNIAKSCYCGSRRKRSSLMVPNRKSVYLRASVPGFSRRAMRVSAVVVRSRAGCHYCEAASADQSGRWLVGADTDIRYALAWPAHRQLVLCWRTVTRAIALSVDLLLLRLSSVVSRSSDCCCGWQYADDWYHLLRIVVLCSVAGCDAALPWFQVNHATRLV